MNKLITVLIIFGLLSCKPVEKETPTFWIWMHHNSENSLEDWNHVFQKLNDAGIQGVLYAGDADALSEIIPIASEYDIDVHAWFWTMNRRDANPEWLSVNRLGQSLEEEKAYVDYYKFMCPALPEARAFIKDHIRKFNQVEGLKGIHMDYVRYVDVILPEAIQPNYNLVQDHEFPEFDYGYHPYMRNLYKEEYGIDPMEIEDPENDARWRQFRYDQLTEAIFEVKELTDSCELILSAAVFPTPDIARKLVRQDWDKWPLAFVFPMIYNEFYYKDIEWIDTATSAGIQSLNPSQQLFSGLFVPTFKEPGDLAKAIESAFSGGASGISIFDYRAMKDYHWEELKIAIEKFERHRK